MTRGSAVFGLAMASGYLCAAVAADLPTKPLHPIDYVRNCGPAMTAEFIVPQANTCAKLENLTIDHGALREYVEEASPNFPYGGCFPPTLSLMCPETGCRSDPCRPIPYPIPIGSPIQLRPSRAGAWANEVGSLESNK